MARVAASCQADQAPADKRDQREHHRPSGSQQQVAQNVAGKNPALDQGIASAPGAQSAAQPQAMAAGGIVAFSGDKGPSDVDSAVDRPWITWTSSFEFEIFYFAKTFWGN